MSRLPQFYSHSFLIDRLQSSVFRTVLIKIVLPFIKKNVPDYFPDWIERIEIPNKSDDRVTVYALCNTAEQLLYLVNEYCLVFHGWLSVAPRINFPDRLIIDLDPGYKSFIELKHVAVALRDMLSEFGLVSFIMLTGSRGVHLVIPIDARDSFDEVRSFIHLFLIRFQQIHAKTTTLEMHIKDRKGKIFLDYLRNAYGQTAVVPYSLRPYPGAPIAVPVSWDEFIYDIKSSQSFHLSSTDNFLKRSADAWQPFFTVRSSVSKANELLRVI